MDFISVGSHSAALYAENFHIDNRSIFWSQFETGSEGLIRQCAIALTILSIPFVFTYILTWLLFNIPQLSPRLWRQQSVKVPPTIPYVFPFVGDLPQYLTNAQPFVESCQ